MKLLRLLSVMAVLIHAAFNMTTQAGSARRTVLLEEVTNWGCGPCANLAPKLDSMLDVRLGEVVALKYHCWWPSANDPFFKADADEMRTRINFLNTTSAPTVFIDGTVSSGYVAAFDAAIDEALLKPQRIGMEVNSNLSESGELAVSITLRPTESIASDNLNLFVCVIEEETVLDSAPNGEKRFSNCVRKMLPNANGEPLGDALASAGSEVKKNYTWNANNFYNLANLGIVAFVQDISTHEVIETVYAPRNAGEADGATIVLVSDVPEDQCSPAMNPTLRLRNTGVNNLKNMNVNIEVNGYTAKYEWEGDLAYLETETYSMPVFTDYELNDTGNINNVRIWLSDINGTDVTSSVREMEFKNSKQASYSVQLTVYTDRKPEETAWKVYDSNDRVVAESEPYTEARHMYKTLLPLHADDCYRVEFTDAGGDGIVGNFGNGYYKLDQYLENGSHKVLLQGEYTGDGTTVSFRLKDAATSGIDVPNANHEEMPAKVFDSETQSLVFRGQYDANGRKLRR